MKKLALLLVLIFAVSFVFADAHEAEEVDPIAELKEEIAALEDRIAVLESPRLTPYVQGYFRGTVTLDKDGLSVDLVDYGTPRWWLPNFEVGFRADVANVGLTIRLLPTGLLQLNSIFVHTDDFGATWYRAVGFHGASLNWFAEIDNAAVGNTAVLNFKNIGMDLGFQDDKAALLFPNLFGLKFAAQLRLDELSFDGAGVELSGSNIIGGLGFRVGFDTRDQPATDDAFSYTANLWYDLEIGLGDATFWMNPYGRFSNMYVDGGVDSGIYAGVDLGIDYSNAFSFDASLGYLHYFANPMGYAVVGILPADPILEFAVNTSLAIGPLVSVGAGASGDNMIADPTDINLYADLNVTMPFGATQISDPRFHIGLRYNVGTEVLTIPTSITTNLFGTPVSFTAGIADVLTIDTWYLRLMYDVIF